MSPSSRSSYTATAICAGAKQSPRTPSKSGAAAANPCSRATVMARSKASCERWRRTSGDSHGGTKVPAWLTCASNRARMEGSRSAKRRSVWAKTSMGSAASAAGPSYIKQSTTPGSGTSPTGVVQARKSPDQAVSALRRRRSSWLERGARSALDGDEAGEPPSVGVDVGGQLGGAGLGPPLAAKRACSSAAITS